jgi:spermidine synthase
MIAINTTGTLAPRSKAPKSARSTHPTHRAPAPDATTNDAALELAFTFALPSVFLISLSVLVFEVALTRAFSVMLTYHFVFAIVSAAMFGLGFGAFLFARLGKTVPDRALWLGALVFPASLAASVALILMLPVADSQALAGFRFWLYVSLAVVPFGAAGFTVAGLFHRFPGRSSLLYGADLLGAAAGALAVVPAMDRFGAVNVVFLASAAAAGGAVLLGLPRRRRALPALALLVLLAGLFATLAVSGAALKVPIANDPGKELYGMLADPANGAQVVESRWSSFGRTDLVSTVANPDAMWIFVDGAAGSAMYNLDAVLGNPQAGMLLTQHFEGAFPLPLLKPAEKKSALVLGPGGGRDVVVALLGGVKQITAVEVNPDVVRIVQQYKQFDGGIYSGYPGVTAIVGEGRNFVRTTNERFDLIMLSIPVTKSSRSLEGYALTENNLFTTQAFEDYLNHLNDNGRIIVVGHNDAEIYKLISLAVAAFEKQGASDAEAMKHIYTVASTMMPAVVIQKQALTIAEADAVYEKAQKLGFDKGAFFVPWIPQAADGQGRPTLDPFLVDVSSGSVAMSAISSATTLDLRPPTDDRPFFFNFSRGLPSPFGTFAVLMALFAAVIVVLVTLPRKRRSHRKAFLGALRMSGQLKTYVALFSVLGIGYMLIEIALFQKLTLYISQPQMALTVLLFSLLLGSGIGSLLTTLTIRKRPRAGILLSLGVAVGVATLASVFPKAFALGLDPRVASTILVLPLGALMGCPFPIAIHGLGRDGLGRHTAKMWGLNGLASVFGSALAMIVGISWGFSRALILGAAIYVVIALLFAVLTWSKSAMRPAE